MLIENKMSPVSDFQLQKEKLLKQLSLGSKRKNALDLSLDMEQQSLNYLTHLAQRLNGSSC